MGSFGFKTTSSLIAGGTMLALATLAMPSAAQAASDACRNAGALTSVTGRQNGPGGTDGWIWEKDNMSVEKDEKFVLTIQNKIGSSIEVYITANSVGFSSVASITLDASQSQQVTLTATDDSTTAKIKLYASDGGDEFSVTSASCPSGTASDSSSQETTSSAVNAAVSRSQTTVIQQNIGARAATIIGSAGAGTVGTTGGNSGTGSTGAGTGSAGTGQDGVVDDSNSPVANFGFDQTMNRTSSTANSDDNRNVMRRMAMRASFDSSVLAANMAQDTPLALGPTDQGTVGGASGVDGRSALTNASPITVWGHGSYTSIDNDYNNGTNDSRYDGDVWGYNIGADYRFADALIAGLSLGYNDTDLTTTFNNGTYQENAWVVSPYAIYRPMENLSLIAEGGYSQGNIDVTRNNDAVSGKTDSALWYASLTTSYHYRPMADQPFSLSPSVAFLAARKNIDSYTESDGTFVASSKSNTRQIKPGVEAAYDFGFNTLTVTPFVETGLVYDFTDELNNDKTAFNIGGGVRMSDSVTGFNAALEASYLAGRTDYTEYTLAGTVSYGFELSDLTGQSAGFVTPFFGSDVDEYGNQSMTGGLGFDAGPMTSRLSLAHDVSQNNNAESRAQISMTLGF
ncbi:MAG TPA: hypothetical protein DEF21_15985 [Thalassospira lucentensis]|uniref:Autotransporter domain-containing protein n=2 Tax=Thalassospira lucentensis TaxID=168935 RepID=A0A358HW28_9PROT|nr:hypothetical protein [Thalassospira lucentensis]HCW66288.1 hypothetical protein [Thalassospira lucentensis]